MWFTTVAPMNLHLPFIDHSLMCDLHHNRETACLRSMRGELSRTMNAFDGSDHPITTYDGGGAVATNDIRRRGRRRYQRTQADRKAIVV